MMTSSAANPVQMPLSNVLGDYASADIDAVISGVQIDSRKVTSGDLFLAIPGDAHDGRQFIEQAVASGAAAVLAEPPVAGFVDGIPVPMIEIPDLQMEAGAIASRFFGQPSAALHMIGVTGTNGKTTTSRLVAQLLRSLDKQCGVIGTLGCTLTEEVNEAGNTTPDPVALQQQLASWRDAGVVAVSMEVSSHALVQGRINGVVFETAVYTNLSRDHLDYHGSMDAYGRAKLKLFTCEGLQHAVINLDDAYSSQVEQALAADVQRLGYSAKGDTGADLWIDDTSFHAGGVTGRMHSPWGTARFSSPLPGDFNLGNLSAAVASVVLAGEEFEATLDAVSSLQPVPGRMQSIVNNAGLQVIIDYAHTPDALEQALKALREHVAGKLVCVFGCGGDRDAGKRPVMGRVACEYSDLVIVTSDNPRNENPQRILLDVEAGCTGDYRLVSAREDAIALAIAQAQPGDCILVAGKGHEPYQIIDDERLPFSDEAHVLDALSLRGGA
ncbi:MAG: UDP-N-acetylmuramoyl-L-alanyl-D-glutamate--2,6-diaminopimelate ligase [Halieaceae bacterium]